MVLQVLIIEDDESFAEILECRLRSFIGDMKMQTFGNLADARAALADGREGLFDLVVLDEYLPDGRGIDLLAEGWFNGLAVLAVSSDDAPELPGAFLQVGAAHFLQKMAVFEPLFKPLVQGILDRNRIQCQLQQARVDRAVMATVKTLLGTLRHEINNPLEAVLGAAYVLQTSPLSTAEQREAAALVDSSGKRIKHVVDELSKAVSLEKVTKAAQGVFQVPGDRPWGEK
jgi:response regulator of citrate/malate metabolism